MTARKRASHVARGRRHQGRAARQERHDAEAAEHARLRDERQAREQAITAAGRELRREQRIHRQLVAAEREYRESDRRERERRIIELTKRIADLVGQREAELAVVGRVMASAPVPRQDRQAMHRTGRDDHPEFGYRPRRVPDLAELRKLNGLD